MTSMYPLIIEMSNGMDDHPIFHSDNFGLPIFPHRIGSQRMQPKQLIRLNHRNPYTMLPRSCLRVPKLSKDDLKDDDFQVCVDVKQFQPKEISVKTVDNTVVVEAKHEERDDEHGSIYRHFIRRYTLPKKIDPKDVVSSLSSDGVLTVKAPLPQKQLEGSERIVQIQQTGPAHLNVKVNGEETIDEKLADKVTLEDAPEDMD